MTYRLGLIHDHNPPAVPDLARFAAQPIPAPPVLVEAPNVEWPMADNDTLGCCMISGVVHAEQGDAAITTEGWKYPGDADVRKVYLGLTGGQDTGLSFPQVLPTWRTKGLFGTKLAGYAPVNVKNTTLLKQAIWIFGDLDIAVNLPAVAQQQFRPDGSGVWELTHTSADYDIEGGHCVIPVGYSREGVVAVTWGSTVTITWEWWATYVAQAYALLTGQFIARGGDGRGFSLAALQNYLPSV